MIDEDVYRALRALVTPGVRTVGFIDPALGMGWFFDRRSAWRSRMHWKAAKSMRMGRTTDLDAPVPGPPERYLVVPVRGNEVMGFAYWTGRELDSKACRVMAHALANALDASEAFAHLQEQANTDDLTGLPNKGAYERELSGRIRRAERVYLTVADLNFLKHINDTQGHAAGDAAIRGMASAINESLRKGDFAARWGGDEFGLLTNTHPSAVIARIEDRLSMLGLVASFGFAVIPDDSTNVATAFDIADERMYADKTLRKARAAVGDQAVAAHSSPTTAQQGSMRQSRTIPEH